MAESPKLHPDDVKFITERFAELQVAIDLLSNIAYNNASTVACLHKAILDSNQIPSVLTSNQLTMADELIQKNIDVTREFVNKVDKKQQKLKQDIKDRFSGIEL